MSVDLMSSIFKIHFQKPILKFVLIAMADNATDEGYCYPSVPTISKKCSLTERSVFRCIKDLIKIGHLRKNNRTHKNGRNTSNEYWIILIPELVDYELATLTECHPHPDTVSPQRMTECHPSKDNHNIKPSIKHTLSDKSDSVDFLFEEFWKSYPLKDKKQPCLKIFKKLKPSKQLFDQIMIGLEKYKQCIASEHAAGFKRRYQLPSTWLNGRGWEDENKILSSYEQKERKGGYRDNVIVPKPIGMPVVTELNWAEIEAYRAAKRKQRNGQ